MKITKGVVLSCSMFIASTVGLNVAHAGFAIGNSFDQCNANCLQWKIENYSHEGKATHTSFCRDACKKHFPK